MGKRKVQFKPTSDIRACPKCGNKTDFTIVSEQVMEDGCEIWAKCKCGYDPSSEDTRSRMEDVWGSLNDDNCKDAIVYTWNELIDEQTEKIK